jgi:hypothetical protein
MVLSEIPFEDIKPGLELISAIGTSGIVSRTYKLSGYTPLDKDGWMVDIAWDNGKRSINCWHLLDRVTVK